MNKKILTKSQRKFVAREKARIRAQFLDLEKQKEEIAKIKERFLKQSANKKAEEPSVKAVSPAKAKPKKAKAVKKPAGKKSKK